MKKTLRLAGLVFAALLLLQVTGCMTHQHVIGDGPAGANETTETQWYALWGLVPLNEVDTHDMVDGVGDYRIETEVGPLDAVINFFTSVVTIVRRSVTVVY